jgi:hypothetical protein
MVHLIWPLLIYWLVLFVICYIIVEFGQNYLYDETTPLVAVKIAIGSFILAAVLTKTRSSYDTMFTEQIGSTVIQAIVWFAVFTLVFRFQPWHAAGIGIVAMALVAGLASLAVDSLTRPTPPAATDEIRTNKPPRVPAGRPITGPNAPAAEKAAAK